jgi:hypothetical protein
MEGWVNPNTRGLQKRRGKQTLNAKPVLMFARIGFSVMTQHHGPGFVDGRGALHYGFVDNYRNGIPKTNFDASRCA